MHTENQPIPPNPERPPMAPHDPPDPAPQAEAWRRALRVVGCTPPGRGVRIIRHSLRSYPRG
ncbi:MAG TPA: hypothetical protein VHV81_06340 [Steroidobacteraceae bacterium]|jgi:hypothetical protein|nr:hypothetical protein [Steroidobacteraceae bacterium]